MDTYSHMRNSKFCGIKMKNGWEMTVRLVAHRGEWLQIKIKRLDERRRFPILTYEFLSFELSDLQGIYEHYVIQKMSQSFRLRKSSAQLVKWTSFFLDRCWEGCAYYYVVGNNMTSMRSKAYYLLVNSLPMGRLQSSGPLPEEET